MSEQKLKVIHLITLLEMGGAQGNTIFTVENLNPEKFDAHLWAGPGAILDDKVILSLPPHRLKFIDSLVRSIHPIKDLAALISLTFALKKAKPDILHTHSSKAGIIGRLAGSLAGVPVIIHTFHGFGFNPKQPAWLRGFYIRLERICAKITQALIFVSDSNKREAGEKRIGCPEQYHLIRSGIDLAGLREQAKMADVMALKTKWVIPRESPIVTTIGPFKPQKNLLDFIRMARLVADKNEKAVFLLIGDGKLRPAIEKEIETQNLKGKVFLLGWQSDIPGFLALTDVFVLTSLWEGLPRAMVEAMSLRIPCVCYDTDGVRDLLEKGGGFLVRDKNPQTAANFVTGLLEGKSSAPFTPQLKDKIDAEFDIGQMVRQQEDLYLKMAGNQPTS